MINYEQKRELLIEAIFDAKERAEQKLEEITEALIELYETKEETIEVIKERERIKNKKEDATTKYWRYILKYNKTHKVSFAAKARRLENKTNFTYRDALDLWGN